MYCMYVFYTPHKMHSVLQMGQYKATLNYIHVVHCPLTSAGHLIILDCTYAVIREYILLRKVTFW